MTLTSGFGPEAAFTGKTALGQAHQDAELRFLDAALGKGGDARFNERLEQFPHPVPLHTRVGGEVHGVRGFRQLGNTLLEIGEALIRRHVQRRGAAHKLDAKLIGADSMAASETSERPSGVSS